MTDRERLHALVDVLPDEEVHTALRFVEFLKVLPEDPVTRALRLAADDDEPVMDDDLAAIREAEKAFERGDSYSYV